MTKEKFCVSLIFCGYFFFILTGSGAWEGPQLVNAEAVQDASTWQCLCGKENKVSRINGGQILASHQYPWMAAVCWGNGCNTNTLLCGGSLINDQYILTAAHCLLGREINNMTVALGVHNLLSFEEDLSGNYEVQDLIIHPNYAQYTQNNDIGLIQLKTKVTWSQAIQPICLPRNRKSYVGKNVYMAGWGETSEGNFSPQLKMASLQVISSEKCDELYGYTESTQEQLCTLGVTMDSCQGDSGGPLTVMSGQTHVQIGVLSWGSDCGNFELPAVYTRVDKYRSWIQEKIGGSKTCPKHSENVAENNPQDAIKA